MIQDAAKIMVMSVELIGDLKDAHGGMPLRRYLKLSTLLMMLDSEAFFPSIATLRSGDPLEGELFVEAPWLGAKLREFYGEEAAEELNCWLLDIAPDAERAYQKHLRDDPMANSRFFAERYVYELARRRAVWCWFESDVESSAMWSIYAHQGLAIGTTLEKLRAALPPDPLFQISRILYADRTQAREDSFDPETPNEGHRVHRPHFLKGNEYSHEREIRVITSCPSRNPGRLVRGIDWKGLITEIIISPLLPYEEARAIENLLRERPWSNPPEIRRSSILGRKVEAQRSLAEIDAEWIKSGLGSKLEDGNLPSILREL